MDIVDLLESEARMMSVAEIGQRLGISTLTASKAAIKGIAIGRVKRIQRGVYGPCDLSNLANELATKKLAFGVPRD